MKDFAEMTADEIASYSGPVFSATLTTKAPPLHPSHLYSLVHSDLESTTYDGLLSKITKIAGPTGTNIVTIRYHPIRTRESHATPHRRPH